MLRREHLFGRLDSVPWQAKVGGCEGETSPRVKLSTFRGARPVPNRSRATRVESPRTRRDRRDVRQTRRLCGNRPTRSLVLRGQPRAGRGPILVGTERGATAQPATRRHCGSRVGFPGGNRQERCSPGVVDTERFIKVYVSRNGAVWICHRPPPQKVVPFASRSLARDPAPPPGAYSLRARRRAVSRSSRVRAVCERWAGRQRCSVATASRSCSTR